MLRHDDKLAGSEERPWMDVCPEKAVDVETEFKKEKQRIPEMMSN